MRGKNKENIRFFSLPDIEGIQTVCGTYIKNKFPRHVHHSFIIGIVDQGTRVIYKDNQVVEIPENNLFIINPVDSQICDSLNSKGHRLQDFKYKCLGNAENRFSNL